MMWETSPDVEVWTPLQRQERRLVEAKMEDSQNMTKPRVLIADDEEVVRDLFGRFLGREDYQVSTARDGLDALNKIKRNNYDVLILDLKMPRMEGMEVLKKTKELKKDLIIIIITGYATVDTAKEAIKQGCFDYITKPFNAADVKIIIKKAFRMRAMAEEKNRLQEQLIRSERLASLQTLAAGMAHEIRNPLAAINIFLQLLPDKFDDEEFREDFSRITVKEAKRINEIVEQLVRLAHPAPANYQPTSIRKVIDERLAFLSGELHKKSIKIARNYVEETPEICADEDGLKQVFLNLFLNSIESMDKGGTLTITTSNSHRDKEGLISNGGELIIEIRDTGKTIPPDILPKIFDPFFSTKETGMGLGLAVVHRIIGDHGGSIEAKETGVGKGTCFCLRLPVMKKNSKKKAPLFVTSRNSAG